MRCSRFIPNRCLSSLASLRLVRGSTSKIEEKWLSSALRVSGSPLRSRSVPALAVHQALLCGLRPNGSHFEGATIAGKRSSILPALSLSSTQGEASMPRVPHWTPKSCHRVGGADHVRFHVGPRHLSQKSPSELLTKRLPISSCWRPGSPRNGCSDLPGPSS